MAVLGCTVAGHGFPPHATPVVASASGTVFADGIPASRQGDSTSCGHASSGSGNVFCSS
ncbi:PAAR domain-containing protein [Phaeobacter gallaeciensis]|uniref:PAAR domain-containing protein n=1 Tax=Phaeobacter gallaeciensis TaxID=60890 RepID=UPI003CD049AB